MDVLKKDKTRAKQLFQDIRLQAKLAKTETKDVLTSTKEELGQNIQELTQQGSQVLRKMNKSLSEFIHGLH